MSETQVKICGIKEPDALRAAIDAGARFVGFVFYPKSVRYVEPDIAKELALQVSTGVRSVGLFVEPSDDRLDEVLGKVQLDMIQLHGGESPERVAEIKARYGVDVMVAVWINSATDLELVPAYEEAADWILFDTLSDSGQYGGTGESFDWSILSGYEGKKPWMLAGGLTPESVGQALKVCSPNAVDVSSGVEETRGVKSPEKIKAFIEAVKAV